MSESYLASAKSDPTKLCHWETFLYDIHSYIRLDSVLCITGNILTGVGRVLAIMTPVAPQTSVASSKYPTTRDRLYRDHTLSTCKTDVHRQGMYESSV